jgi:hypothetical protein
MGRHGDERHVRRPRADLHVVRVLSLAEDLRVVHGLGRISLVDLLLERASQNTAAIGAL